MNNKRLLMLVEIAIFAGIGVVLDKLSFSLWAQGGSISFVMVPILLIAIRWGLSAGIITGLLIGLIQILLGGYILHWAQGLLDYIVAFSVVGFAGIFRKQIVDAATNLNKKEWDYTLFLEQLLVDCCVTQHIPLLVLYSLQSMQEIKTSGCTQSFITDLI